MRSSMPGTPLGIFEKSPLPSSLPRLRPSLPPSYQKSQWSVEITCRSLSATACQSASWSLCLAERRRADPLGALEAGPRQIVLREEEVLDAGLAVDRPLPRRARQADRLDRARVGDVDDVERRAGHLGQPDGAVGRLGLQLRRARQRVVLRVGVARRASAWLHEDVNRVAVLGMDHDEQAVLAPPAPSRGRASRRPPSASPCRP